MNEALCSILCGEKIWNESADYSTIKFNEDGTGEIECKAEMNHFILAKFKWKSIIPLVPTGPSKETGSIFQRGSPKLLGELRVEVTLTKRLVSWVQELPNNKKNSPHFAGLFDRYLTEATLLPKIYNITIEKGNFVEPWATKMSHADQHRASKRYALRLTFDKSPFPPRSEGKDPTGGPDSLEPWTWTEFVGRPCERLKYQGRAMNQELSLTGNLWYDVCDWSDFVGRGWMGMMGQDGRTVTDKELFEVLCGEERGWNVWRGVFVKFEMDGTGRLTCYTDHVPYVLARIRWENTRHVEHETLIEKSVKQKLGNAKGPQLLGDLGLEITLERETDSYPLWTKEDKFLAKFPWLEEFTEKRLTEDAFQTKVYNIKIEKGNFDEPYAVEYPSEEGHGGRYALRLLFDASPFPLRAQWKEKEEKEEMGEKEEEHVDANKGWTYKELVGRPCERLKKQGPPMNNPLSGMVFHGVSRPSAGDLNHEFQGLGYIPV